MQADTVRYYFFSNELGRALVPEPKNYKEGNGAKYKREDKSKGIMRQNSNELEFINSGYDYLLRINTIYGVVPDVRVDKWMKDDKRLDQRWTFIGSFGIDITSLEFDHDQRTVKAKYTNGGLADKLDSRLNETYDLIETTGGVDGTDIGPLNTVDCSFLGKAIFLESRLDVDFGVDIQSPLSGGDKDGVRAVPFQVITDPDGQQFNNDRTNILSITDTNPYLNYNNGNFASGQQGGITYLNSERNKILKLEGRVHYKQKPNTYHSGYVRFGILVYDNGLNLDFKEFIELKRLNTNGSQPILDCSFNISDFSISEGESFTFAWHHNTDDGYGVIYQEGNFLNIIDEQPAPPTIARSLTFYEVFNRLMARAFGANGLVVSELLTTGEFRETLKTNGFFIRQFPDVVNKGTPEERKIQFKTSLNKQLESANAIMPIAWWVAKYGDKEVLRIEKLQYTQQDFVGVNYGETLSNGRISYIPPQRLKRKVLGGNYYSSVQIGSLTSGSGYDDFFGLTCFCGNATYTTVNDSKGVPYTATTEDRTGDLDIELERRKPYEKFPDADTPNQDSIFFIDAKKISENLYTPRMWQDDFETIPLNVYSPETSFNFNYQPERLLLNHGFEINVGLYHWPFTYLRWSNDNNDSLLITKKAGEDALASGQAIPVSRLDRPRVKAMLVDFQMVVPLEVEQQINNFQPDGTPNWFGRVAVEVNGNIEYMRLIEVDTNKEGKHKMIEAK